MQGDLTTGANIPTDDLTAVMAGIYGSAPGCLCTFPNSPACPGMEGKHEKLGQIATTVARPDRGYGGKTHSRRTHAHTATTSTTIGLCDLLSSFRFRAAFPALFLKSHL